MPMRLTSVFAKRRKECGLAASYGAQNFDHLFQWRMPPVEVNPWVIILPPDDRSTEVIISPCRF